MRDGSVCSGKRRSYVDGWETLAVDVLSCSAPRDDTALASCGNGAQRKLLS